MSELRVDAIIFREDLYPRFEPNPQRIQQYSESIELLPPIEVNQHNELIDGYHRWTAHKKVKAEKIQVIVTQTKSDDELLKLSIKRNATGVMQLGQDEKKSLALKLYTGRNGDKAELCGILSVSERTMSRWTSRRDKDLKDERDKKIADMWLACYTEEEIAEAVGCGDATIREFLKESAEKDIWQKARIFANYTDPDWTPPLYDIWKAKEKSNKTTHFGNSEASFLDNLLYMYTQPFDIVVDPFGGGGSTIDVCKRRLRRYWVSDRLPIPERRDIRQADILDGAPQLHKRWSDVSLLYLDPPYWKQAEGEYSKDKQDLSNMSLDDFYKTLTSLIKSCSGKMKTGTHIAMLMQPTQWRADDRIVVDHIADLIVALWSSKAQYLRRIVCPYESQQCNAQQVEWAKENKDVLVISRELIIWKVK